MEISKTSMQSMVFKMVNKILYPQHGLIHSFMNFKFLCALHKYGRIYLLFTDFNMLRHNMVTVVKVCFHTVSQVRGTLTAWMAEIGLSFTHDFLNCLSRYSCFFFKMKLCKPPMIHKLEIIIIIVWSFTQNPSSNKEVQLFHHTETDPFKNEGIQYVYS